MEDSGRKQMESNKYDTFLLVDIVFIFKYLPSVKLDCIRYSMRCFFVCNLSMMVEWMDEPWVLA